MTRKSANRILRDARKKEAEQYKKENTIWADLQGTYNACAQALGQHAGVALMLNRKEVFPYLKDHQSIMENIRTLTKDLQAMNEELKQIHGQHADKQGGTTDPDEVIVGIQIFEQYHLFLQRQEAVLMPTAMHILEEFNHAEQAYNAALAAQTQTQQEVAQAQASDPAHVDPIDVPFTETAAN